MKSSSAVNLALYRDGRRVVAPETLAQVFATRRDHPGAVAWVGLCRPSHDDVALVAREFDLHELPSPLGARGGGADVQASGGSDQGRWRRRSIM